MGRAFVREPSVWSASRPPARGGLFWVAQMAAHVAGEIDVDAPLREAPLTVAAIELSNLWHDLPWSLM